MNLLIPPYMHGPGDQQQVYQIIQEAGFHLTLQ